MSLVQFPPLGLSGLLTTGRVPFAQSALGLKDDSTFTFSSTTKVLTINGLALATSSGITFSDATVQTTAASTSSIGAVPTSRQILTSGGLQGGGNLTADRTLSIATAGVTNAMLLNSSLTVTAGTGLSGGGSVALGASVTLSLPNTGPGAGTITHSTGDSITLDAQGRVTAVGVVTRTLTAGTGLTGGGTLAADRSFAVDQSFSPTWSGSHTFSNNVVLNGSPTLSTHAVNKGYVDAAIQGLNPKAAALVLASANITLSGTQTIDGIAVVAGNRVLAKGQTTTTQNGLWVVAAGAWTRPVDFATGSHAAGAYLFIEEGTTYGDTAWVCTTDPPNDVVDTNALTFVQFSGAGTYTAGSGLTLTGTVFSIGSAQVTNAMLANSSVTISVPSILTGGGSVSLGGTLTLSLATTSQNFVFAGLTSGTGTPAFRALVLGDLPGTGALTVTAGTGLSGGGSVSLGASVTLSLPNTGPGAGTIGTAGIASITLDAQGRVTAASTATYLTAATAFYQTVKNSAGTGQTQRANLKFGSDFTVTDTSPDTVITLASNSLTVTAGTGLSGGGSVALGGSVTLSLPATGTSGAKTFATGDSITTDTQGRVTASTTVTRQILSGTGITGGGNLTADRTLAVDQTFSPTWTGAHTWSTGTATFAASAAKINNAAGTFATSLVSAATAARTWTYPDATDTAVGLAATQTLTNKTISGSSNTLTNIANGSLTNSSLTVTAGTGLSGGGAVALGSSVTLSLPNTGPGAGTIGGAGSYLTGVTLDAQGRVTAATSTTVPTLYYQTVQSAGVSQTQRGLLNLGAVFGVTDDAPNNRTTVTIAAAGVTNAMLANSSLTVTAGTGLSGGGSVSLGSSVTVSLPNTGPGAGTIGGGGAYVNSITLDAQGRVTAASTATPGTGAAGGRTTELLLTTTSATSVVTYTPGSTKGLWVAGYFRVVTAATNVTIVITYTDVTGTQTYTAQPLQSNGVGSFMLAPIFIVSTAAVVTVTFTAGTASQVYASASIVEA